MFELFRRVQLEQLRFEGEKTEVANKIDICMINIFIHNHEMWCVYILYYNKRASLEILTV